MLEHLTTEARNPASEDLDGLTAAEIVRLINAEDAKVAAAVADQADAIARAIDAIAERLARGGRLVYVGAGTSGRLGVLDAVECPPTFNTHPTQVIGLIAGGTAALTTAVEGAEDRPELAIEDLKKIGLSDRDVVVGIATSGRTPYVLGSLEYAQSVGAFTIGLSCNRDPQIATRCDLSITPVVGPEVVSGSTRMKAGTATKMVLNMLSTGAMIRLGKTYGNLMVDLRASNSKLADRARRIVRAVTNLSDPESERLLRDCGGEVKTAIVSHYTGFSSVEARRLLDASQGHLRRALEGHRGNSVPSH
jgi:N-acetylmuramic acid 6-phosphate etherase